MINQRVYKGRQDHYDPRYYPYYCHPWRQHHYRYDIHNHFNHFNYFNYRLLTNQSNQIHHQLAAYQPKTSQSRSTNNNESSPILYDRGQFATPETIKDQLVQTESWNSEINYHLEVVQQPVRARMCGFGEKDRRPISPHPFVRLRVSNKNELVDSDKIDPGFFVLQATIFDLADKDVTMIIHPTSTETELKPYKNLVGEVCANGRRLIGTDGKEEIWFLYKDLSVRTEGTFYLKFTLINVGLLGNVNTNQAPVNVIKSINSQPFTVYTAKKFPGMLETTALTNCFALQGNKIPRRDKKKRKEVDDGF